MLAPLCHQEDSTKGTPWHPGAIVAPLIFGPRTPDEPFISVLAKLVMVCICLVFSHLFSAKLVSCLFHATFSFKREIFVTDSGQ